MKETAGKSWLHSMNGNSLFWLTAFCCFLPFLILPFLNHPVADDYIYETAYRDRGFTGAQEKLYTEWIGRFTATFIQITFVKFKLVSGFYFLHTILLFVLTFFAFLFTLTRINRFIFNNAHPTRSLIQAALVFLLLNLYVYDDVASSFYWFSGAITYQTPVILFIVLLGLILHRFNSVERTHIILIDILSSIIIILLGGCNETFAITTSLIMFSATVILFYYKSTLKRSFSLYFLVSFLTGIVILSSSGIMGRQKMMTTDTSYITVFLVILFRISSIFFNILKEPLFWVAGLVIFILGLRNKSRHPLFSAHQVILTGMIMLIALLMLILTPLMVMTKGAYPPRALNNLILLATICLFIIFFFAGRFSNSLSTFLANYTFSNISIMVILCVAMTTSTCYMNAWKSVCSAYFYNQVMLDRKKKLAEAQKNNQHTITFLNYEAALREKIDHRFPNGTFSSLYSIITQKPTVILFSGDAETIRSSFYLKYYNMDSIYFSGK